MADQIFTQNDVDRFFAKTWRNETTGCLEWTGGRVRAYGESWGAGRIWRAHRMAWTIANGPIPPGLCVLHHCDNPPCVEVGPGHLFLGTQAENMADMTAKGRRRGGGGVGGRRGGPRARPWYGAHGERHGTHTHPERVARGEAQGSAKLTASAVVEMRAAAARGESAAALGRRFHVSGVAARDAIRGVTWSHVPGTPEQPQAS